MSRIPSNSAFENTPRILSNLSGFLTSQKPNKFNMSNLRVSDWTDARNKRNLDKALKESKAFDENFKRIADEKLAAQKKYFDGQAKRQAENLAKLSKQTDKTFKQVEKRTAKKLDIAIKNTSSAITRQVDKATQTASKAVSRQVNASLKTATKTIDMQAKVLSREITKVSKNLPFLDSLAKAFGGKVPAKFSAVVGLLGTLATAGVVTMLVKTQEEIQEINLRTGAVKDASFDKVLDRSLRSAARLKTLQTLIEQIKQRTEKLVSDQAKALYDTNQRTVAADKKANDALYEVRAGRKILENQIDRARKPGNDALFEVRQGRQILNARIEQADKKANDALFEVRAGRSILEGTINARFNSIAQSIPSLNQQVASINNQVASLAARLTQSTANLTTGINNARIESSAINSLKSQIDSLKAQLSTVANTAKTNSQKIEATAQTANAVNSTVKDLRFGNSWKWERQIATENKGITQFVISRTETQSLEMAKLEAAIKLNKETGIGLLTAINRLDREQRENQQQVQQQVQQQINQVTAQITNINGASVAEVRQVQAEVAQLKRELQPVKQAIPRLEFQVKEQERMNNLGLKKLDNIAQIAALIPARAGIEAANRINPRIPTKGQLENAAATGVCRTTQPGGCINKALNDNATDIKNNSTNNAGNILDAVNAVGQGIDLSMLTVINDKLGDQLPGGLTGGFSRLYRLLQIDRVLNILTYINTLHNAFMLSNNIGQTLFSAFDNIAEFAGFKWKNEKDEEVSFSEIVGDFTENFFKSLFGEENYNAMATTYKKANRIYQAGANILNATRSIVDSVRNIGEFTAENTGRIGNALRKFGVVGDDAYKWMPEQVNAQSIWVQRLNNLEEAASGIEMVTGELASITQNINEIREQKEEFEKSITDSPKKEQKENTGVKNSETAASNSSQSPAISPDKERNP